MCDSLGSGGVGGGSGGGVSSTPTPPSGGSPAPTIDYDTAEYQRSTGSVAMDAIAAYDAGATGSGITVAVIDSGIDTGSAEFSGRISAASRDMISSRNSLKDENGHGTAVSGIIGAARNDRSEEHTSELPSLMRHSYAVLCLKKKKH